MTHPGLQEEKRSELVVTLEEEMVLAAEELRFEYAADGVTSFIQLHQVNH